MTDRNGKEMKTGDYVIISGAFFKNDNATYIIEHSPGDENWTGRDYSLRKIKKDGSIVKNYNVAFWPLTVTVNDCRKYREAKAHNDANFRIFNVTYTAPDGGADITTEVKVICREVA